MIQAQANARRKLDEILKGPYERLATSTVNELKTIKRRAKKEDYTISFDEQTKIDVAYELVLEPGLIAKEVRKKVS